jgi:hypothetical protein
VPAIRTKTASELSVQSDETFAEKHFRRAQDGFAQKVLEGGGIAELTAHDILDKAVGGLPAFRHDRSRSPIALLWQRF